MKEYIPILFSKALAKIQFRSPSATLWIDSSTAQVETVCSKFSAFCKVLTYFRKVYPRLCKVLAHFRKVSPCLCKVHHHLRKVRLRLRKVLYIVLEVPTRSLSKRWIGVAFAANWIIGVISTNLNLFSCIYWLTALIHS